MKDKGSSYLEAIGAPYKSGASVEDKYLSILSHRPRVSESKEETPGSLLSELHIRRTLKNKFYAELRIGRKSEEQLEEEYVRKLKNDGKTEAEARKRIELWKSNYPEVELSFHPGLREEEEDYEYT